MKNSDKILAALHNIYPGADITVFENLPAATETVYVDGHFIGDFCLFFWDDEVYKPEIEIKVKAPLYKIKDFLEEVECDGVFYHAVERGFKEWEEGSARNN